MAIKKYYENTINYYNNSAKDFFNNTVNYDWGELRDYFLLFVPEGGSILDFGCGSGRDTKYFKDKNYIVEAIDGSNQLCEMATNYSGVKVRCVLFQNYEPTKQYDGIWASASLLHLDKDDLEKVIKKLASSLKEGGCLYMSFKYGDFCGVRHGRYFIDQTETDIIQLINEMPDLEILELLVNNDSRAEKNDRKWLSVFLKKR